MMRMQLREVEMERWKDEAMTLIGLLHTDMACPTGLACVELGRYGCSSFLINFEVFESVLTRNYKNLS